ncbi:MAG: hypothetical protein ABI637_11005 [Gemmatimonadota bacterium]
MAAARPQPRSNVSLTGLTVSPATLVMNSENQGSFTVTITNRKKEQTDLGVQGYIQQAGGASQGAGGTVLQCPGAALGVLPRGTCQFTFQFTITPTAPLVTGPATYHLELSNDLTFVLIDSIDFGMVLQ